MEELGYYFTNWNSDVISIGVLINVILIISGYFWGKLFQKFAKSLKKIDATFLGIFFILAVFQIFIFYSVTVKASTMISYYLLAVLVCISPILCLVFRANVLPTWKNLASLIVGIGISYILCWASSKLNTNNIFFDSVTYLSQVIENMESDYFGYMVYAKGWRYTTIEPLHDFTGYYYFWSMLLRWAEDLLELDIIMTPIYIWGATVFYGMALGNLVVSSANLLYKKWFSWKGVLLGILILSPYYSNYFNTTLAFFGNTMRSVLIGWAVLLVYAILNEKEKTVFPLLTMVYYAAISVSSSSFFICAMVTACLFFALAYQKGTGFKTWIWFILSCTPLFHYALIVVGPFASHYFLTEAIILAILLFLIIIAILLRKHIKYFNYFGMGLLPVAIIALVVLSLVARDPEYDYSFYYTLRSLNDMTVNITNYVDQNEFYRNLMLYGLLLCLLINFKKDLWYKWFLLVVGLLFLNPLVQPAVSTFLTSHVYSRSFDIIVNPFTIIFLLYNIETLFPEKVKFINYALTFIGLPILGYFSYQYAYQSLTVPYSQTLVPYQEDYNWKYKVSEDSLDMYDYIQKNIIDKREYDPTLEDINDNFYDFISQDVSMKAYVNHVKVEFTSTDYRDAMENAKKGSTEYQYLTMFYPDKRFEGDGTMEEADYSGLQELLLNSPSQYLIMNNTLAVWNERGWFDKVYAQVLFDEVVTKEYENTSWVLFKINHDWKPKPVEEPVEDEEVVEP